LQREAANMANARPIDEPAWRELRAVLDEEIASLPDKYRGAIVLCYLEGKSYAQAAREIGCPKSSLASRLARARKMLGRQLERRDVGLAAGGLATAVAEFASAAPAPALLSVKTVKAMTLAAANRREEALALADQITQRAAGDYISPVSVAYIYTFLGESDQAFENLKRGARERDPNLLGLKSNPIFDGLRTDPRYDALLRKMHLEA